MSIERYKKQIIPMVYAPVNSIKLPKVAIVLKYPETTIHVRILDVFDIVR